MTFLTPSRRLAGLVGLGILVLAVAVPVLGADPSPPVEPPGQAKERKADRGPEITGTLRGTLGQTTDERGRPTWTLEADGVTWELSAGPKWFWEGADHPLAAWVGQPVEVAGTYREGETELDVETVNGQALRAPGKPPWAGGPAVVGEAHPGWKAWKADGKPGNGHGRDGAPGQRKDKPTDAEDGGG